MDDPQRRLLVFDVEGTLFETNVTLPGVSLTSTIWQALAAAPGSAAVEAEIETHRRWERGEYASYLDWMKVTRSEGIRQSAPTRADERSCESPLT
jgi:hypothetical protein